jgi:hypothetical protein
LPEKIARTMVDDEVPTLDRPVRFIVTRGQRGAVRADTLDELQDILDRPWSPEEYDEARPPKRHDRGPHGHAAPKGRGGPPGGNRKFQKKRRGR